MVNIWAIGVAIRMEGNYEMVLKDLAGSGYGLSREAFGELYAALRI